MIDTDIKLDIQQELSEIPPEYQDAFRRAIGQELAETEQNRTDTDILAYLRRRRDDFKQGSFIRPDGRPGMVALSPEMMYEQALPQLVQSSLGEPDRTTERRRTLIKLGVFAGLAVLLFIVALRGRAQRAAATGASFPRSRREHQGAGFIDGTWPGGETRLIIARRFRNMRPPSRG